MHNAINARMRAELRSTWAELRRRDDMPVVVLTGASDAAFSPGSTGPRPWPASRRDSARIRSCSTTCSRGSARRAPICGSASSRR
ncbi:MAG: hypothetical protein ACRD0U_15670 [Acidimicrobiales bacterium]